MIRFRTGLRVVLSLFLLWHFPVVLIAPNSSIESLRSPDSLFNRYVGNFALGPYWSFFAPEPGPPPIYLEWELENKLGQVIGRDMMPQPKSPYFFRDQQSRRIAFTSFVFADPTRLDAVMTSYICKHNPEADAIRLYRSSDPIPTMLDVAEGRKLPGDEKERVRQTIAHSFCKRKI